MSALPLAAPAAPEADLVIALQAILDEHNAVFGHALLLQRDASLSLQLLRLLNSVHSACRARSPRSAAP